MNINNQWLWEFLRSPGGIQLWLGPGDLFAFFEGSVHEIDDGTTRPLKALKPNSHWRITRCPPDPADDLPSSIQVRVIPKSNRSILAFHEEHLPAESQRRAHYLKVIDQLFQEIINA